MEDEGDSGMELIVRRLEWEDLPERVAWFNTPSVYTNMLVEVPMSLARTQRWFEDRVADECHQDFSFLMRSQGEWPSLCAMGGLTDISPRHRSGELYVVVRPGETRRGIGSAVVKWLCNYGFLRLGLWRIQLHTFEHNEAARRLYEMLGFVHEGVLRESALHHGDFANRHVQALLRPEWEKQPWRLEGPLPLSTNTEEV